MNTTLSASESLASIREQFTAITQEHERLESERRGILVAERNQWRADGVDAHIVSQPASGRKLERRHLVSMLEIIADSWRRGEWKRDVAYTKIYAGEDPAQKWGPYASATGYCFWLHKGAYVCVLADDESAVIVDATKFHPISAEQISRAVSRLRSLAQREHMRVSVHDTAVTIKSPMNDVVHEGDINSAYLWLCGLDQEAIEDRTKNYWEPGA
jgi:hypothetical protein